MWQWDALPEKFRQNPHISLDWEHVFVDANKYKATDESTEEGNNGIGENLKRDLQGQRTGIPRQRARNPEDPIRQEAMVCREKLKELTSITYNIENLNGLKELNTSLELLVNKFKKCQTIDEKENFPQTLLNKQVKSNGKSSAGHYLPLPVRPKKNRYKNRVGAFASMMQKHYKVNVPVNGASSTSDKTQTKKSLKRKNKSGLKYSTPAKKQRRDWGQPPQNVPTLNSETSSSNGINDAPTPAPTENSKPQSAPQKHTLLNESGESAKENTDEHNCNSPCDPVIPSSKSPVKNLKRNNKSGLKYSTPAKKQRRDWGQPPQNVPTLNSETSSSNGINDAPTPAPTENSKPQSAPQKHTLLNESGESAKENTDEHNCNSPCDPVIPSSKSPVKNLKRNNKSGLKYSTPAKKQRRDWGQPPQNVPTLNSETSSSNGINDAPTPAPTENSKPQSAPQKHTLLNESGESAKENTDEHNCNSPCDPVIPSIIDNNYYCQ